MSESEENVTQVFNHLRGYIGARVWSPMGEAMLSCVADDYVTVVLTSDGRKMRYYDPTAVLLYVDSEASLGKKCSLAVGKDSTEISVRRMPDNSLL